MIRKIDEKYPDWQSRRTPADGWSPAGAIDAPGSVARSPVYSTLAVVSRRPSPGYTRARNARRPT
jgi:hypothetical protein